MGVGLGGASPARDLQTREQRMLHGCWLTGWDSPSPTGTWPEGTRQGQGPSLCVHNAQHGRAQPPLMHKRSSPMCALLFSNTFTLRLDTLAYTPCTIAAHACPPRIHAGLPGTCSSCCGSTPGLLVSTPGLTGRSQLTRHYIAHTFRYAQTYTAH